MQTTIPKEPKPILLLALYLWYMSFKALFPKLIPRVPTTGPILEASLRWNSCQKYQAINTDFRHLCKVKEILTIGLVAGIWGLRLGTTTLRHCPIPPQRTACPVQYLPLSTFQRFSLCSLFWSCTDFLLKGTYLNWWATHWGVELWPIRQLESTIVVL